MTQHLFRDLDLLKREILLMGGLVEAAINNSIAALVNHDAKLAEEVLRGEDDIDRKELEIGEECLKVLALHQPVAGDLRFIVAVMMVNNDLERMADLAANVAERALHLADHPYMQFPGDLQEMTEIVRGMVKDSLDSLVNQDIELAMSVVDTDDNVDDRLRDMYKMMQELIRTDPESLDRSISSSLRGSYTIIIVTHNMQQAARVSDLTAFLYEGYLIEFGETDQVFTRPREKQTEDYVTGRFG